MILTYKTRNKTRNKHPTLRRKQNDTTNPSISSVWQLAPVAATAVDCNTLFTAKGMGSAESDETLLPGWNQIVGTQTDLI